MRRGRAMTVRGAIIFGCLLTGLFSTTATRSVEPISRAEGEARWLELHGESYWIFLKTPTDSRMFRVNVLIDDRPTFGSWQNFFLELFGYFDRNHDRRLDAAEATACPAVATLRQHVRGNFLSTEQAAAGKPDPDDEARIGVEGLDQEGFVDRCFKLGLARPELIPPVGAPDIDARLNRRLFELLSGDDGELRAESFARAGDLLARYDADGDERISFAELAVDRHRWPTDDTPPAEVRLRGPNDRNPIKMEATAPLIVNIGEAGGGKAANGASLRTRTGVRIRLKADREPSGKPTGGGAASFRSARAELLQQWETDDADADGALSDAELRLAPSADGWRNLHAVCSPGAAAKHLKKTDWQRYVDVIDRAAGLRVEAHWRNYGRTLTMLLDSDGDRMLTPRELADAWRRLEQAKIVRQDRIRWDDVPQRVSIRFSLGAPKGFDKPPAAASPDGPTWFAGMDRNGDGEISRREFLGKLADFERLDADNDGLISAEEAR